MEDGGGLELNLDLSVGKGSVDVFDRVNSVLKEGSGLLGYKAGG